MDEVEVGGPKEVLPDYLVEFIILGAVPFDMDLLVRPAFLVPSVAVKDQPSLVCHTCHPFSLPVVLSQARPSGPLVNNLHLLLILRTLSNDH